MLNVPAAIMLQAGLGSREAALVAAKEGGAEFIFLLNHDAELTKDCLPRLNGMFAFGLWDGRRQELLLARDRLGVKPLYYAVRPDGVLFGSEPKAILAHPEFRAEVDAEGLAELFSQIGTKTPGHGIYRGLLELRPGTVAVVGRGGTRVATYWSLPSLPHADDLAVTAAKVRDLLTDTVHRQTVADVPLCSLLSGGLDSSVVSALAADSLARRDRAKLATFSVDFEGSADAFQPDQLRPSQNRGGRTPASRCRGRERPRELQSIRDSWRLVGPRGCASPNSPCAARACRGRRGRRSAA